MKREEREMEKSDVQIGLRVTKEFKARLEAQADREHRKVSNLIVKVMLDYLEQVEPKESAEEE